MRLLRRTGLGIAGALIAPILVLILATVLTARSADPALWPPAAGAPRIEIFVVSHGYHSGLVLPRDMMAEAASHHGRIALGAVVQRFSGYRFVEVGWGDESFYRHVPNIASLTFGLAVRALFRPGNPSVLHVVGVNGNPRAMFANSDLVPVDVGGAGFARLADMLDASFARGQGGLVPEELGPGLYGLSLFFRANGTFHLFHLCNHWIADLLDAAGVPTAPLLATLPSGLLLDLKWRSGLVRLPIDGTA
jgi:uncharacterized protein (TIGR02117 family)